MERGQHLPQHAYRVLGEHQPTGRAVTGTVLKNIKANELIFLCVCIGGAGARGERGIHRLRNGRILGIALFS